MFGSLLRPPPPGPVAPAIQPLRRLACAALVTACSLIGVAAPATAGAADLDAARAAYEREDYDTAYPLYERAAAAGDAEASYRVGLMRKFGWGTTKDAVAAARALLVAAEKSHPEAQAELGVLYRDGRGVPEDAARAVYWLKRAAEAGVGIAQLNLGRAHGAGRGTKKDPVEAYAWFTLAAANGYVDGLSYRARIAEGMSQEDVARAERLVAERRTAVPAGGTKK